MGGEKRTRYSNFICFRDSSLDYKCIARFFEQNLEEKNCLTAVISFSLCPKQFDLSRAFITLSILLFSNSLD